MGKITIQISNADIEALKVFASLPTWIIDEWNQRYGECNADPLPIGPIKRLLEQMPRPFREKK